MIDSASKRRRIRVQRGRGVARLKRTGGPGGAGGGSEREKEYLLDPDFFDAPTANVSLSIKRRVGLPDYCAVEFSASLTLPAEPTPEKIDEAAERITEWLDDRLSKMAKFAGVD